MAARSAPAAKATAARLSRPSRAPRLANSAPGCLLLLSLLTAPPPLAACPPCSAGSRLIRPRCAGRACGAACDPASARRRACWGGVAGAVVAVAAGSLSSRPRPSAAPELSRRFAPLPSAPTRARMPRLCSELAASASSSSRFARRRGPCHRQSPGPHGFATRASRRRCHARRERRARERRAGCCWWFAAPSRGQGSARLGRVKAALAPLGGFAGL